jgi:hypothetical protein
MAMGVGTYPRFFLILLPFGLLIVVRGFRVAADWLGGVLRAPALGRTLFAGLAVAAALAGAARLPRLYTLPKQDYTGALAFVRAERESRDLVAAAYMAQLGIQHYEPSALAARTAPDLEAILARGEPVWLIGTLEEDMRQRAPDLAAIIGERFREVRRFPGIIGDGTMIVWRSAP